MAPLAGLGLVATSRLRATFNPERTRRRIMVRKLGLHVGLYGLLLVAVLAVIGPGSSFGSDDGAYGGQVFALRHGAWALDRPLPVVAQDNEGWLNSAITPSGPTPYTANPAYSMALTGVVRVVHGPPPETESAGDVALGLHLLPTLGALGSAVVAWFLAKRWNPEAAPLAFWLLGLGPVLVNSTTLWAHTLSTALGGLALLAALAAIEPPDSRVDEDRSDPGLTVGTERSGVANRTRSGSARLLLAVAATAALCAAAVVRTEAVFWIVGLAVALVVIDRSRTTLAVIAVGGGLAGSAWLASRAWSQHLRAGRLPIETSIEALNDPVPWAASRFPAAWRLLMTSVGGGVGPLLTLGVIIVVGVAAVQLRGRRPATGLLLVAVALYAVRVAMAPGVVINGSVGAWPALGLLLLTATWTHHSSPRQGSATSVGRALLVAPSVLLVFVLATQYGSSGGHQWGGRYLSLAFAPLAAAAAVAGFDTFRRHRWPLTGLIVAPAIVGLVASYQLHHHHQVFVEATTNQPSEVVVTDLAPLPRLAWPALPTAFYRASPTNIEALLIEMAEAEVTTVNVHGLAETDVDGMGGYQQLTPGDEATETRVRHLVLGPDPSPSTPSPEARVSGP